MESTPFQITEPGLYRMECGDTVQLWANTDHRDVIDRPWIGEHPIFGGLYAGYESDGFFDEAAPQFRIVEKVGPTPEVSK